MRRIVVAGGSLAGVNAVAELRDRGFQGELTLVGAEPYLPYDRPPLSKEALREGPEVGQGLLHEQEWYDARDVTLRLGSAAVGLDAADRVVHLADGAALAYDGLVIATGCTPRRINAPVRAVHVIGSIDDAIALHAELRPGRHVVVVGAGLIGLEVAAIARLRGLEVSVVETAAVPLSRVLGIEAGAWFRRLHADNGVEVYCGVGVSTVEPSSCGTLVRLDDGTVLVADLVVAGVGVAPATDWLVGSGVAVGDGIRCDRALRTTVPDVVAAGDVVRWHNDLFGESMRNEQWLNAVEQGAHAARTLLGSADPFAPVPYFWSDQFDAMIRFVGHADAYDQIEVVPVSDRELVALYGRAGIVRGALCVNAPRALARCQRAIRGRLAWEDRAGLA